MTWETTKIKADVKEEAKEESFTYTEIMQIGVEAIAENLVGRDGDGEVYLTTSDTQGNTHTNTNEDVEEIIEELETKIDTLAFDGGVLDEEAQEMMERLDRLESAVKEATEYAQRADRKLEEMQ